MSKALGCLLGKSQFFFLSHTGCSGQNATIFSCQDIFSVYNPKKYCEPVLKWSLFL